ncbi:hypothetical protein HU200_067271 [Digitaria exilis]|uniref:F-box protein AT5G49610-like beta-propeller domain-containing protein n=1 Tax=Digitaria exilis TaxID=1010633 RepID=A0A835A044_9POAL|nr:hypothetical protein HU200_067271 [Digitaria exilis]
MNLSKKMKLSPAEENNTSASKVLTNDGMLGEILERLHCPANLIRAALTSRRWLHNATSQPTICGFRKRQSPHLLGIYVTTEGFCPPEFVPLPDPSCPEFQAEIRHGNFGFDGTDALSLIVLWDSRSERVLYGFDESFHVSDIPSVRMPLRCPTEQTVVFPPPPPPPTAWPQSPHAMLLPDEHGDNTSCYRVDLFNNGHKISARVLALRSGSWTTHCSASTNLSKPPVTIQSMTLLMCGKIYMLAMAGYILLLDLAASRFSTLDLPKGVEVESDYPNLRNVALCRGDSSALYLIHVNGDKVTVWFQRMTDHDGAGSSSACGWSLRDTISLHEACDHIEDLAWELKDGLDDAVSVVGAADNAEFVFLEFLDSGVIVCIRADGKNAKVVYNRDPNNDFIIRVHPFMAVWPPILAELVAAPAE